MIKSLRDGFKNDHKASESTIGEKLKNLNVLMGLDLILGDEGGLERHYQKYLSTLANQKLFQMMLVGGYGIIETAMFQGRQREAGKLLSRWVDTSLETNDDDSILLFAKRQLAKNRLWSTAVLLEAFLSKRQCPFEARYEAQVLRCSALNGLCKILQIDDIAEKGLTAKVQSDWVATIGKDGLEAMLGDLITQAKSSFARINDLTESQKKLKEQLERIEEEIN